MQDNRQEHLGKQIEQNAPELWAKEMEAEADFLEQRAKENTWERPESYEADRDAMLARIKAQACEEKKPNRRSMFYRIAAAAAVIVLVIGVMEIRSIGEKVYVPEENIERQDGDVLLLINNEERVVKDIEETEIYQQIDELLGIRALRLKYKPQEMKLFEVDIEEDTGEAWVLFLYEDQILRIYVRRDYSSADVSIKQDGNSELVNTIEIFNLRQNVDIYRVKNEEINDKYWIEIVFNNVLYVVEGIMDQEEFSKIIEEIYLESA